MAMNFRQVVRKPEVAESVVNGALAFRPASSAAGRTREAFEALREENRYLSNQLLDARRALQQAHERIATLKAAHEQRLAPAVLSPAEFALAIERSQTAMALPGPLSRQGPSAMSGVTHHYHGPVHFHIHTSTRSAAGGALDAGAPPRAPGATLRIGPVSCACLKNRDKKGRSDPFVRVRGASAAGAKCSAEFARKDDELHPSWEGEVTLDLPAGEEAAIVEVWDHDTKAAGQCAGGAARLDHHAHVARSQRRLSGVSKRVSHECDDGVCSFTCTCTMCGGCRKSLSSSQSVRSQLPQSV